MEAKFYPVYPPSSFSVERIENNFIFYKKYVNRLSWAANPENKSELENYKLYRKVKGADDSTYELIATLDITVFSYDDRGLDRDQLCTYKVTAVNKRGKESDPIVAGN